MSVPIRGGLIFSLICALVLVIARQVFDFMGFLWLPILVNFTHILLIILGLFGAFQYRISFLLGFIFWCFLWSAWNGFLICLYLNVGMLNRNDLILSFFAEGSHSFWTQHTPLCKTHYDINTRAWTVTQDCYLNFYWIEIITAGVHIVCCLISACFACIFIVKLGQKFQESETRNYSTNSIRRNSHPRVTMEFADPPPPIRSTTAFVSSHPNGMANQHASNGDPNRNSYQNGSIYDGSSGYLNTSFESSPSPGTFENGFVPALDPNGRLVQSHHNNKRKSSKKRKKRQQSNKLDTVMHDTEVEGSASSPTTQKDYPQSICSSDRTVYSTAPTVEAIDRHNARFRSRSHSASRAKKERRRGRPSRSISPPSRSSFLVPSITTVESRLGGDNNLHDQYISSRPSSKSRASFMKQKPFKHHATPGLAKFGGSQHVELLGERLAGQGDPQGELMNYNASPRRISIAEPRGLQGSADSILNGAPKPAKSVPCDVEYAVTNPPVTSLVSFDPKSNTLIRYHDHLARSRAAAAAANTSKETQESSHANSTMDDSQPPQCFPPPPPPLDEAELDQASRHILSPFSLPNIGRTNVYAPQAQDRISYDSGLPPSLPQNSVGPGSEFSSTGSTVESSIQPQPISALSKRQPVSAYSLQLSDAADPLYGYQSHNNYINPRRLQQQHLSNPNELPNYDSHNHSYLHNTSVQPSLPHLQLVRNGVLMAVDNGLYINNQNLSEAERIRQNNSQFLPSLLAESGNFLSDQNPSQQKRTMRAKEHTGMGYYAVQGANKIDYDQEPVYGQQGAPVINDRSLLV